MPRYEYHCPCGNHMERFRPMSESAEPTDCTECGKTAPRIMSRPAGSPDGIYSYAPNIGDPDRFERQRQAIKDGTKVIKREMPRGYEPRE